MKGPIASSPTCQSEAWDPTGWPARGQSTPGLARRAIGQCWPGGGRWLVGPDPPSQSGQARVGPTGIPVVVTVISHCNLLCKSTHDRLDRSI